MAKTYYGGQAVIEGVMMKGPKHWGLAVRTPEGDIVTTSEPVKSIAERWPIFKKPLFRGIVVLIETLVLGIKTITLSASLSLGESEEEITPKELVATLGLALFLVVGLFMVLPFYLTRAASAVVENRVLFSLVEGLFRITIFVLYIVVISRVSDIKRVFQYHGAEHKTIHAFEHGDELEPSSVAKYSSLHVRCGTSFMLIVMVVAIFSFSFLPTTSVIERVAGKLLLIPIIAGISYEVTRLAARHEGSRAMRLIMAPGLALQRLTTKEPDESQIEVAVRALQAVFEAEGARVEAVVAEKGEEFEAAPQTGIATAESE